MAGRGILDLFAITFDVEWAPDYAIDFVTSMLRKYRVKSSWFVTHDSKSLRCLREDRDLFECGIHPNFLTGSTHGDTEREVLKAVKAVVPEATVVRTHGLFQSSKLMGIMVKEFGIEVDVSIFLANTPNIVPHSLRYDDSGKSLVRVPYFWEDDLEWFNPAPCWHFSPADYAFPGLKIFNFHPLLIYANLHHAETYSRLKTKGNYQFFGQGDIEPFRNKAAPGPLEMLEGLCRYISSSQQKSYMISEIVDVWRAQCE